MVLVLSIHSILLATALQLLLLLLILIMPRLIRHRNAKILAILTLILTIYGLGRHVIRMDIRRRNAVESILKATGPRNVSSSRFVLPTKSTTLLQPGYPNGECEEGGRRIFALFVVTSSPENRDRRNAIRKGWGNAVVNSHVGKLSNKVLFLVGVTNEGELTNDIEEEWKQGQDLIVEDFVDTYFNLTLKVLRLFKWHQIYCPLAKYLVKIDDDVHLQTNKFINLLKTYDSTDLVAGHLYNTTETNQPIRDVSSHWFVPEEVFAETTYPNFISGTCYILGAAAVSKIYQAALSLRLFHLEDVFITGMVAVGKLNMNLTHINSMEIHWSPISERLISSCYFVNNYISIHSVSLENLQCWNLFNSEKFVCDQRPIIWHC